MSKRHAKPPVEQLDDTSFVLRLDADERQLLKRLLDQLTALLTGPADDARLRRIFPPAYLQHADQEAEADYQRLMREELVASRLTSIATVDALLARPSGDVLTEGDVLALMQAVNGVRLVLGTILDVTEDDDDVDDDDPMAAERHLYHYLSWLLDWIVRSLGT